ncbi:MarR family winged helix-turn-helix transcriptional regulator [Microbacterium allomyrinae]|uniref:MarR family transcriptional regulator n=1 Tax=Microbacterium allomyrinae TaxID=2830666 RepID=A0A9X1LSZ3_9MICO|nr:MarR family transcriptional regulator [Microbacterium allomyrinae]MCC2031131.1 MarR family transcriptional regulator [Microbacterium allomyrinae]
MATEDMSPLHAELLTSLTDLMSRWSSSEVQTAIAGGVGVRLDPIEVRAVYTLGLHGGRVRPSELADALHLTRPTTSKLIARLVADGLVLRTEAPGDGRGTTVAFTPAGEEAFRRLAAAGHEMVGQVLAQWTTGEAEMFGELLRRFVDGLLTASPVPRIH